MWYHGFSFALADLRVTQYPPLDAVPITIHTVHNVCFLLILSQGLGKPFNCVWIVFLCIFSPLVRPASTSLPLRIDAQIFRSPFFLAFLGKIFMDSRHCRPTCHIRIFCPRQRHCFVAVWGQDREQPVFDVTIGTLQTEFQHSAWKIMFKAASFHHESFWTFH